MKKKILLFTVCLFAILSALSIVSGAYGDNNDFSYYDNTLTIYGNAKMNDYSSENRPAWYMYREETEHIIIEDGVKSIGDYAFSNFESLKDITIPNTVKSIGKYAFNNCNSIKEINIPSTVKEIGYCAFTYCSSLEQINVLGDNHYFSSKDGVLFDNIRNSIVAYPSKRNASSYTIPENILEIADYAFYNCDSLTEINFSDYLVSIGISAFHDCDNIASITFPDSVQEIGEYAFCDCDLLSDISFGNGEYIINSYAFSYNKGLESVSLPENLKTLGENAFANCKNLQSINIPKSITEIGTPAFEGSKITEIYYDGSNKAWENVIISPLNYALSNAIVHYNKNSDESNIKTDKKEEYNEIKGSFDGYTSTLHISATTFINNDDKNAIWYEENKDTATKIEIANGALEIQASTFENFVSLENMVLPKTIKTIGDHAFDGCNKLKAIELPAAIEEIGEGVFAQCENIRKIKVKSGAKHYSDIDGILFKGNTITVYPQARGEKEYTIPENVEAIEKFAFKNSKNLESVTIPASVTTIGEFAFDNCSALTDVYFAGSAKDWEKIDIAPCNDPLVNAKIHYAIVEEAPEEPTVSFEKTKTYMGQFEDVASTEWYYNNVAEAYEYGLVNGITETSYNPAGNITIAQTIVLACRLHSVYNNTNPDFASADTWYAPYVDYARENNIISTDYENYNAPATRSEFVQILYNAIPENARVEINEISAIPDIKGDEPFAKSVYDFYKIGVLSGSDSIGTFNPSSNIRRSEVAAIIVRIIDPSQRKSFVI